MKKLSDKLRIDHECGYFAEALEGYSEQAVVLEQENQRLKEFANTILAAAFQGCDMDGADIYEAGVATGVLEQVGATESCGENCKCAEYGEFPLICYRKTY